MGKNIYKLFAFATLFTALIGTAFAETSESKNATENGPTLIDEAWRVIDKNYYDTSFGGVDWKKVRDEFQGKKYSSTEDAYRAIRTMLEKLGNPSTRFLTPSQTTAMMGEVAGRLESGTGLMELLSIDVDEADGGIVVVTPVANTPAAKAGLKTADQLVMIDGRRIDGWGLASVMSALRGPEGSVVELMVRRGDDIRKIPITRETDMAIDPVDVREVAISDINVGYLGLTLFTNEATDELITELERLNAEHVDGIVLDLRNNPGGHIGSLQKVAAAFLGDAELARADGRNGPQTLKANGEHLTDKPMAVIINEGTASAAEILASALKYHDRARLVGAHSFGKGLIHGFARLSDGSGVMYTAGRLLTLAGDDILIEGVSPDVPIKFEPHPVVEPIIETATSGDLEFVAAVSELGRQITDSTK